MSILLVAVLLQELPPINAACPVKPGQKSRAANAVVYKGRLIGLC